MSRLYNPHLPNGHSIEAWAYRLGVPPKLDHEDWSKFSPEMLERCNRDVDINIELFKQLTAKMKKLTFSELSCKIEHEFAQVIEQQTRNGIWFDVDRAKGLLSDLRQRQTALAEQIQKLFPPRLEPAGNFKFRRKQDGSPFAQYGRHLQEYDDLVHEPDGTYTVFRREAFNIGSPVQRIKRLLDLGWEPTSRTPKGNPKVDEDSLNAYAELSGKQEIRAIAEWLVLQGRSTMVEGWLSNVSDDHRIHGKVIPCGASTRRCTHNSPNTANIPSGAKAKYGHECRSLWTVEPGKGLVLVGYDAAGLETAGLLHYLNNPVAAEVLLRPKPNDVHSSNARALTEALQRDIDREWGAKTSWYAWLYGAFPKKLGEIVKGTPEDGEIIIKTFFKNVPGLEKLIKSVQDEFRLNDGLLRTIDGGYVRCPSLNAALNYKIQSAGAIVMKLAAVLLDQEAKARGIWFRKVLDVHDEGQLETKTETAEQLGKIAVSSITKAGEILKFNVPLTGDYKIGASWAETH